MNGRSGKKTNLQIKNKMKIQLQNTKYNELRGT